ncbi:MAG: PaaI family thioesterase [Prevotella sp.]|nr:PaaI family thioesterase [Prevotella sp.]
MELTANFSARPDGLTKTLAIEYHATPDPATLRATMRCTPAVAQPWGVMSGGAMLALAENLAGVASMCLAPGYMVLGINISATHVSPIKLGETAIATAILLRKGGTLHNWRIELRNPQGELASHITVTNYLIKEQEKNQSNQREINRLNSTK